MSNLEYMHLACLADYQEVAAVNLVEFLTDKVNEAKVWLKMHEINGKLRERLEIHPALQTHPWDLRNLDPEGRIVASANLFQHDIARTGSQEQYGMISIYTIRLYIMPWFRNMPGR